MEANKVARDYWAEVFRGDAPPEARRSIRPRRHLLVRTVNAKAHTPRR